MEENTHTPKNAFAGYPFEKAKKFLQTLNKENIDTTFINRQFQDSLVLTKSLMTSEVKKINWAKFCSPRSFKS